jgi:hypothetical protein
MVQDDDGPNEQTLHVQNAERTKHKEMVALTSPYFEASWRHRAAHFATSEKSFWNCENHEKNKKARQQLSSY